MKSHMLQLDPPIPVVIHKDGKTLPGYALGWLDYSQEHDLMWLVATDDGGEPWIVPNKSVRLQSNFTLGRSK